MIYYEFQFSCENEKLFVIISNFKKTLKDYKSTEVKLLIKL